MPLVQGPDGAQFSFPDGTDPATMHAALTQHYANVAANPTPVNITIGHPDDKSVPIQPSELEADGAQPSAAPAQPASVGGQLVGGSGMLGSALRGFRDEGTLGFGPKASALVSTGMNYLGRAVGANNSTDSFADTYKQLLDMQNRQVQADSDVNPGSRFAGQAGGVAATLLAPGAEVAKGANMLTKIGVGAANGALYGGLHGAGSAPLGSEGSGAAQGAATGAAFGGVAAPVVAAGSKAVGPIMRDFFGRVTGADAGNAGMAALTRRTPLDPQAMADETNKFRAAGVQPTVGDIVTPQARRIIANAGTKASNGQALVDQATTRAVGLPGAVSDAVSQNIAGGGETAATLGAGLKAARKTASDEAYSAARNDLLTPNAGLKLTLGTKVGQSAINDAIDQTVDPATRQQLKAVGRWAAGPDQIPADPLPPGLGNLSAEAQAAVRAQLGLKDAQPVVPPPYTAGHAQAIAASLQDKADKAFDSGAARRGGALKTFADAIKEHAAAGSPTFQQAQEQHVNMSQPVNALDVGAKFTGGNAGGLATPDVAAQLAKTQDTNNPLTQSAARVAARDQVLQMAGRSPTSALSTADHLSLAPDQRVRNVALLGNEAGDALANTLGVHAKRVRNATGMVNTGIDNANANPADIDAIIGHALTGGKSGVVYAVRRFLGHGGMQGLSAQKLVEDATSQDPARVNAAIGYVSKAMDPNRATLLVGSLARVAGGQAGGIVGGNQ